MQKQGKHSWKPKYRDLDELLGITEAKRRGGFSTGAELTDVAGLYRKSVIEAMQRGEPPPDPQEWLSRYHDGDFDDD